jgi:pimeloyl-ACP methyl ester carboxylesterase
MGGMIAPWIHGQFERTAFLVLLAPPSLPGYQVLAGQEARVAKAAGAPPAEVDSIRENARRVFDLIRSDRDSAAIASRLRPLLGEGDDEGDQLQLRIEANTTPWFRDFARYDPRPALRWVDVSALALFGGQDLIVPPRQNVLPLHTALRKSASSAPMVQVLEGLNHWMQPADTGRPSEVATIETTIAPDVLGTLTEWIRGRSPEGG